MDEVAQLKELLIERQKQLDDLTWLYFKQETEIRHRNEAHEEFLKSLTKLLNVEIERIRNQSPLKSIRGREIR